MTERTASTTPVDDAATTHRVRDTAVAYALSVGLFVLAHTVAAYYWRSLGPAAPTIFLGAVVISALYGGYGPGLLLTAMASVDLAYTFMPPYHSFTVDFQDALLVVTFFAVALVTGSLQAARLGAEASLRRAHDELEHRVRLRTAELTRSQEQFSLLVNGVSEQAVFTLDRDGRIGSWNSGAERLLGFPAAVVGRPVAGVWPGVGPRTFDGPPVPRLDDQGWVVRADGSRFWAAVVLTPLNDDAGRPRGYALALRDLTERRTLERDVLDVAEREQQRIGHDLHDGLGQELTGISMLSDALADELRGAGATAATGHAERIAELARASIGQTRDLARGLCPVDLEDEGLAAALRRLAEGVSRLPNVVCRFDAIGPADDAGDVGPDGIGLDVATHLYRIVQEAIHNALRHGHARRVDVTLHRAGGRLRLSVVDNGHGIGHDDPAGMGLRLMQYRARTVRGTLDLRPGPAGGTCLVCELDLLPGAERA